MFKHFFSVRFAAAAIVCLLCVGGLSAQSKPAADAMGLLKASIEADIKSTDVPMRCDTLHALASRAGEPDMCLEAEVLRVRHIALLKVIKYTELREAVRLVGRLAAQEGLMNYYYRAYYYMVQSLIRHGNLNLASYELRGLLAELSELPPSEDIVDAYALACQLAEKENRPDRAYSYARTALGLAQKIGLDSTNLCGRYMQTASMALVTRDFDAARQCIDTAYIYATTPRLRVAVNAIEAEYYMHQRDSDSLITFVKRLDDEELKVDVGKRARIWSVYHIMRHHTGKSVENLRIARDNGGIGEQRFLRDMSAAYAATQRWDMAYRYSFLSDSLQQVRDKQRSARSLEEFRMLFDIGDSAADDVKADMNDLKKSRNLWRVAFLVLLAALLGCAAYAVSLLRRNRKIVSLFGQTAAANRRLEKREAKWEADWAMRNEFVKNVCHELAIPTDAQNGLSEALLAQADGNEQLASLAGVMRQNTREAQAVIKSALMVVELESLPRNPCPEEFDILALACEVLESESRAAASGVEAQVICDAGAQRSVTSTGQETVMVTAERIPVKLILQATLNNAFKYTSAGSVSVVIGRDGFAVADTGIGIPAGKQQWAFERFHKINEFGGGAGLGLSLCREACERIGATIDIDQTYMNGTRIVVVFPESARKV